MAGSKLPTKPTTTENARSCATSMGVMRKIEDRFAERLETKRSHAPAVESERNRAAKHASEKRKEGPFDENAGEDALPAVSEDTECVPISRARSATAAYHRVHCCEDRADGHRGREKAAEDLDDRAQ
jgi:hypothetical protein